MHFGCAVRWLRLEKPLADGVRLESFLRRHRKFMAQQHSALTAPAPSRFICNGVSARLTTHVLALNQGNLPPAIMRLKAGASLTLRSGIGLSRCASSRVRISPLTGINP